MRIPSDFTDDNLYRRRNKRPNTTSSSRRLLRLIAGLVLVVMVMRQASRPEIYETFFAVPMQSVQEIPLTPPPGAGKPATDRDVSDVGTESEVASAAIDGNADEVSRDQQDELREMLGRVIDGSVWRSEDFDAFYGCLGLPQVVASFPVTQTGVLPLLQQPDVYLGQGVRVVGKVARGEKLVATPNPFEIDSYWQVWLRPIDGSGRPVLVVVRDLPQVLVAEVATRGPDDVIPASDAATIEVDGIFLKRLAYRSAKGAELAPVVVGRVARMSGGASLVRDQVASSPTPAANTSASGHWLARRPLLTFMLVILAGFLLAATMMVRSGQAHARLRTLRAQRLSEATPSWDGLTTRDTTDIDPRPENEGR